MQTRKSMLSSSEGFRPFSACCQFPSFSCLPPTFALLLKPGFGLSISLDPTSPILTSSVL